MTEINKSKLSILFGADTAFMLMDGGLAADMLEKLNDDKSYDIDTVTDKTLLDELFNYVEQNYKWDLSKWERSFTNIASIIAAMNNRTNINKADLVLLSETEFGALGYEDWPNKVVAAVRDITFKDIVKQLDVNNDLKDDLGAKIDEDKISKEDIEESIKQRDWLDKVIPEVENYTKNIPTSDEYKNDFMHDEIVKQITEKFNDLIARMKYQRLTFDIVANK